MNRQLTGRYDLTFGRPVIAPKTRGSLDYFMTDDLLMVNPGDPADAR